MMSSALCSPCPASWIEAEYCTEHIVTLRNLSDSARRKKIKLFITFIDFSEAYDQVPRQVVYSAADNRVRCGDVIDVEHHVSCYGEPGGLGCANSCTRGQTEITYVLFLVHNICQ